MLTPPALHTSETPSPAVVALAAVAAAALVGAVAMAFFYAPQEATMGVVQRIFYFHVPSAILTYAGFVLCCCASVVYLVTGSARADVYARAGAELCSRSSCGSYSWPTSSCGRSAAAPR